MNVRMIGVRGGSRVHGEALTSFYSWEGYESHNVHTATVSEKN